LNLPAQNMNMGVASLVYSRPAREPGLVLSVAVDSFTTDGAETAARRSLRHDLGWRLALPGVVHPGCSAGSIVGDVMDEEIIEITTDKQVKAECGHTLSFRAVPRLERDTFLVVENVADIWVPLWVKAPRPWGAWVLVHER
jgi:hypothetical protein